MKTDLKFSNENNYFLTKTFNSLPRAKKSKARDFTFDNTFMKISHTPAYLVAESLTNASSCLYPGGVRIFFTRIPKGYPFLRTLSLRTRTSLPSLLQRNTTFGGRTPSPCIKVFTPLSYSVTKGDGDALEYDKEVKNEGGKPKGEVQRELPLLSGKGGGKQEDIAKAFTRLYFRSLPLWEPKGIPSFFAPPGRRVTMHSFAPWLTPFGGTTTKGDGDATRRTGMQGVNKRIGGTNITGDLRFAILAYQGLTWSPKTFMTGGTVKKMHKRKQGNRVRICYANLFENSAKEIYDNYENKSEPLSLILAKTKIQFSETKNKKLKHKIHYLHAFWRLNIDDLDFSLSTQLLLKKFGINSVYDLHYFILKRSSFSLFSEEQQNEIIKTYYKFGFNSPFY